MSEIYEQNVETSEEVSDRNVEMLEEIYDQNAETPEVPDWNAEAGKDDSIQDMEDSLGNMMKMRTPVLDTIYCITLLPFIALFNPLALNIALQVFGQALAFREAMNYAYIVIGSELAGIGVQLIQEAVKNHSESNVKKQLSNIFKKENLIIHTFSKGGEIPLYLLNHQQPAEEFDGAVSGDLISLQYRDYTLVCCNVALTHSPVEGFEDSYTQDDLQARKYFEIKDNQSIVFYGSVFMFFPGPAIKGNVRLAPYSPLEYLGELHKMNLGNVMNGPEYHEQRMDSFRGYHYMEGENYDNQPETGQVFTRRVKDMIMRLEWKMHAPVSVYADKNMVCLTIQDRVYDFECIHDKSDPDDEVKNALYNKINSFKEILDMIIGPEGFEYTELLGSPAEQRKSAYTPFLKLSRSLKSPEDDDIQAYVHDLAEWSTDLYRFDLHYSQEYLNKVKELASVSIKFLSVFVTQIDSTMAVKWFMSTPAKKYKDSLIRAAISIFRYLWDAPGKCEVRNIRRKEMEDIPGLPPYEITFDIVVNPPIRKWEYLSETNRRMVEMCKPSRFCLEQLNDEETQKALVEEFSNYLKTFNPLRYDVDYIYPATITLNEGEKYGMPPEEISKFCKWYTDLMAENMEFNGEPFILRKEDENKQGE